MILKPVTIGSYIMCILTNCDAQGKTQDIFMIQHIALLVNLMSLRVR